MGRLALAVALLLGLLGAWRMSDLPAPAPADAPAATFSSTRAMADVRAMAQRPHPAGSADHARVRALLAARMRAIGLVVRAQPATTLHMAADDGGTRAIGADVVNLIGVLPGRDRAQPAVALMAHYDSVPGSPGAADDGAGVAAAIEIARAIRAGGVPAHDLVLILTDAEEAGLHGARAFFASDPLRRRIGFLINMDVRGDAGRAIMHETGPDAGGAIALYARTATRPLTDSIAAEVKRHIRNNTDFSIARDAGVAGLNFSFLDDQFDYHAASSTAAAMDVRSLQHLGDQALAAARGAATMAALPAPAADPAYASLLGIVVVHYPPWFGWVLLAGAGLLAVLAWRRGERPGAGAMARGAAAAVGLLVAAALAIHLLRIGTGIGYGFTVVRPLLARWEWFEAAILLAGLATALGAFALCRPPTRAALPFGAFAVTASLALFVQALAPAAAVLLCWSLLGAALVLLLAARSHRRVLLVALVAAMPLAQIFGVGHVILLVVGENIPEVGALFALLAALVAGPLLARAAGERGTGIAAAAAGAAAVALTLAIRLTDPASAERPRPSQILYVADVASGRSYRVTSLASIDGWTAAALRADGHAPGRGAMPPVYEEVSIAAAQAVAIAPPRSSIVRLPDGRIRIAVAPDPRVRELRVRLAATVAIRSATVNGIAAPGLLSRPNQLGEIMWTAPARGLAIDLAPDGRGRVAARLSALRDGWPAGARPLPPRPKDTMPWYNSDTSIALWTLAL